MYIYLFSLNFSGVDIHLLYTRKFHIFNLNLGIKLESLFLGWKYFEVLDLGYFEVLDFGFFGICEGDLLGLILSF